MTQEAMTKIEDRIIKLLAKAQKNDNVNEAAIAMNMVEKLLEEHNLSLASVTEKIDGEVRPTIDTTGITLTNIDSDRIPAWLSALIATIGVAYPVRFIFHDKGAGDVSLMFFGAKPDPQIAAKMYKYLYQTLFRAWANRKEKKLDKASFFTGFCAALYGRVYKMVNERNSNLGAIVLAKQETVNKAFDEKYKGARNVKSKAQKCDYHAYRMGEKAASTVPLAYDTKAKHKLN